MGLNVTAYRHLVHVPEADAWGEDQRYDHGLVTFYANPQFFGREAPLYPGKCYRPHGTVHFYAGSYHGYNWWRASLARLAGYSAEPTSRWRVPATGPFVELIDFSDCEGTLGTFACIKLAQDFLAFQPKADLHADETWRLTYYRWRDALTLASDGGALKFH